MTKAMIKKSLRAYISIDETIDTRLTEKEQRMTEIMESMPIPLFSNIYDDLGDEDIKALIKDYVRRTKKS